MMRLRPLVLEDIPLTSHHRSGGPVSAEKNQAYRLKLSSDAQQTTLPGGHGLPQESTGGAIRNYKTLGRRRL
jgi:hypothetical protein